MDKKRRKLNLETLEPRQLLAVDFNLLQDIETKPGNTSDFAVLGAMGKEVAFAFTAQDPLRFRDQLWEVPSNESGPAHPLHDAGNLGTIGTTNIVALNGRYLFNSGSDKPEADGLWSTDGTPAGSFRLGPSSTTAPVVAAGKAFYFVHEYQGTSLWVTDGTLAGTRLIAEDRDEQDFHFESALASDSNQVYMVVKDHLSIRHIATIDSNDRIVPLVQFPAGDTGQLEFVGNGKLLVTNRPSLNGPYNEVYSYTANQGLVLLSNQVGGIANLPTLQISGGRAFFSSDSFSLWSTDGTVAGTKRILDDSYRFPSRPAVAAIGNHFLFAANHDIGIEYFYSDGTASGTVPLGVNASLHPYYYPIASSADAFYFMGADDVNQFQFYRVDASTGDLLAIASIPEPGPSALPAEGQLFFNLPTVVDERVFYTDGKTLQEYLPLQNKTIRISPDLGTAGTSPEFFAQSDQYAWFKIGQDLWQTDGSTGQTGPVLFLSHAVKPEFFYHPQVINGQLVFEGLANTFPGPAEYGRWSVDPQSGAAIRLNLSNTRAQSEIAELPSGMFQIRTDGTTRGIYQISADLTTEQPIAAIPADITTDNIEFTRLDDRLIFVANSQLWQTDGTASGTVRINTLSDSELVNSDLQLDKDGNLLLLTASRQIYRVDVGSPQATFLGTLTDNGVSFDNFHSSFLPTGAGIVFVGVKAGDSFKEKNLWFSNGVQTRLLRDFTNGEEDVAPVLLGKVGENVIVASGNQRLGYSLWSTDGTAEKTVRILHSTRGLIWPTWGTVSQTPDGRLLVAFFDAELGREIWITDGTASGTELFSDIAAGANNSNPRFSFFGDNLLAFASTTAYGAQEPFVADFNQFVSTRSNTGFQSIVDENHLGAFLGTVTLNDIPASELVRFQLHSLDDVDRFVIDAATGDLRLQPTFAFDFEFQPTASVDIDVDFLDPFSQEILTRTVTVEIQVVNRIEAPVIQDQILEVDENLGLGEFVGKIVVGSERDATISFVTTGGWPFKIDSRSGQTYVFDPSIMDYELHHELVFGAKAFDSQNALSATAKITVRLRNIDEPPVLSPQLAPASRTIFSGAESSFQFDAATFVDPEGQPVTYRVTMPDGSAIPGWLTFDASTRLLTSNPTSSAIGVHTFRLIASDAGGNEAFVAFQITVLDGQYPWHNAISPLDVNRDGKISPLDALLVINRLNLITQRTLPSTNPSAALFYDTNRDGSVSPIDALFVINHLNNRSGAGEGEQAAQVTDYAFADIDDTLSNSFSSADSVRKRRAR